MPRVDVRGVIVPNDDKEFYEWFGYEATSPKDVRAVLAAAGVINCKRLLNQNKYKRATA